jgi:alanine-glyoxylate transaminase / serine-glyoxylate transaminase / serine-pyruvate transaminase
MPARLMIPGPVELQAEVLAVLAQPVVPHYGAAWVEAHNETIDLLKQIYRTTGKVQMLPGSGSLALDAAAHSAFLPGDTVIVGNNGWFGERTTDIMQSNGVNVVPVQTDPRHPLDPEGFLHALRAHPDVKGVACVYLETSTGILNPVREIAALVHEHSDALVMVDAVTGLGGAELEMDAWGIDLCAAASQKGLGAPAGLGMVALSERAWQHISQRPAAPRSWYLDLARWQWYTENWADWHPFPVTMPTSVVLALRESLRLLLREGLTARMAHYVAMARLLRDCLAALDMPLFAPEPLMSPILTAAYCPPGVSSLEIRDHLLNEHNIQITTGFGAYRESVFRVGHMGGALTLDDIALLVDGLREFVEQKALTSSPSPERGVPLGEGSKTAL